MSEPLIIAIVGIVGAALGAVIAQVAPWRRVPSEARLAEAKADREQHEAGSLIITNLSKEVERLKAKIDQLEARLGRAETAAANANEFRRAAIVLGEKLDGERAKILKLLAVIENLLDFAEGKITTGPIDRIATTRVIQAILDGA